MATSVRTNISIAAGVSIFQAARYSRRRHIDPVSGHALEVLGHAIEYLTDELVEGGGLILADNPRVEAVQLLMALNRQIYLQCPEVKTFGDRCRSFLRIRSA
jgi:hypothetical protein